MHSVGLNRVLVGIVAGLFLVVAIRFGFNHLKPKPIAPDEFVQALDTHQSTLIDRYFSEHQNPNARAANDRSLLFAAMLRDERDVAQRLLAAGASADLADSAGVTPLMVAAMHGDLEMVRSLIGNVSDLTV